MPPRCSIFSRFLTAFCLLVLLATPVAAANFTIEFVDNPSESNPKGDFQSRGWLNANSDFQRNVRAAAAIWGSEIDSARSINMRVEANRFVARTGGTFSNGRFLGNFPQGARFEPGPLSRVLTGTNPGGPTDLFIGVNAAFVDANYWLDPTPENRRDQAAPSGRTDFVSIVLHEMGHGLGIAGTRNFAAGPNYGLLASFHNPFDALSSYAAGMPFVSPGVPSELFFSGTIAQQVFRGLVPLSHVRPDQFLSSQNFYHLGTCGSPAILERSLMNGCSVPVGANILEITAIDRAVILDLGYPEAPLSRNGFEPTN